MKLSLPENFFCDADHYRICENCGKLYLVPRSQLSVPAKTCSESCKREMISKTYRENIPVNTFVCQECGDTFTAKSKSAKICNKQHYRKCVVCGKLFPVTPSQIYSNTQTCSESCRVELVKKTSLNRYGADNYLRSDLDKTHIKSVLQSRYGVDNPMQIESSKVKAANTNLSKYGVTHFSKTPEFISKCIETNQFRYGHDWAAQSPEFKEKSRATCQSKYGVDNGGAYLSIACNMTDPTKIETLLEFKRDPKHFIDCNFSSKPTLSALASMCGVRDSSIGWILQKLDCTDLVKHMYSRMETEVVEFLYSILGTNCNLVRRTKQVITPYELDIYLPDYHIGFECNPTSTHNVNVPVFGADCPPVDSNYHKNKTDLCNKNNIFLFHIFGYEWTHKKDICKSMIMNILHCTSNRIYGRNTTVKVVPAKEAYEFLSMNHRQGGVHCKVRIGLYYQDSLVSLMTFSKIRNTLGTGKQDLSDCWELVRFCNRINTSVVGGASKLFQYFVQNYGPTHIRSFSDKAHTKGDLYSVLGFIKQHESNPGYCWVNVKTDLSYSRVNAQKRNIKQFLHDDTINLDNTEVEIMVEHGFVQVYDSGTVLWEWSNR